MAVFGVDLEKDKQTKLEQTSLEESYGERMGDERCPYRVRMDTGWGGTLIACPAKFNEGCHSEADQCSTYHQLEKENV